ncbi:MAG: hypothetical protein AUJ52_15605 [Elusimicrobia bacterium CG1_02_63_36]|nr:MAG: hypothetical protein AUJ52_15605 [Elusimicrobia bacterium CG1_02_63_36]
MLTALLASGASAAPMRGVLEGFYGRPWSWGDRRSMVAWMSSAGFDLFVLAPKDEAENRLAWRDPLKREYLEGLLGLLREADRFGVSVAWGLQPIGVDFDDPEEVRAAADKIRSVATLGVGEILLAFDDLEPDSRHFSFANRVRERLREGSGSLPRLTFVPAVYWGRGEDHPYLKKIRRSLHREFRVAWTGPSILSSSIRAEDAAAFARAVGHPLVMGDNYPVQDRLVDAGRLFLGPVGGREAGAVEFHEAWVANGSPLAETSKFGLYTTADFLSDPVRYERCASMRRAAHSPGGLGASPGLRMFVWENASSWLDAGADPGCGGRLADALRAYRPGNGRNEALAKLQEVSRSATRLVRDLRFQPDLRRELEPWTRKLADETQAAAAALELSGGGLSERREALLKRLLKTSKGAAERNPAIVSNQEITRFLNRLEAFGRGEPWSDPVPLNERLRQFARKEIGPAPVSAALTRYEELPHEELVPWLEAFSMSARRARKRWDGGSGLPETLWRWKVRLRFLPLLAARSLMEEFFSSEERGWGAREHRARVPFALKAWLLWRSWTVPESFSARLWNALENYRRTRDASKLKRLFNELAVFPEEMRERFGSRIPVEVLPWIDRVGDYGRLGLRAIRLSALARQGITIHGAEREDWERLRWRIASGNGLELALETKLHLDAFGRWALLPALRRPKELDLALPANAAEVL